KKATGISLFGGNIYATVFSDNKVCCYKETGEPLWIFQHHDIDSPEGIAVDKHGFVYIISRGIDSIVVVSPDGKTCKTILSEADGINFPVAIDIHREKGMMIMSSKIKEIGGKNDDWAYKMYHTAFVYKI
ncbi:Hypothetical predicted protein, partial [Mytilus galloprovincialis]